MGIIVNDMTMPESCFECEFCVVDTHIDYAWCVVCGNQWDDTSYLPRHNRFQDCPLIEYKEEEE